jgi:signal transduction histidine kinase
MPPFAVKGIRTKIIGAIVLLLVFIGLISFWVSYMHEKKSLLTNMQDNAVILNRALIISITNQKTIEDKVNLQTFVEELSLTEGVFGVWVIDNQSRITSATFREQVGEVASSSLISETLRKKYFVSGFDVKMGEDVYCAVYPLKKRDSVLGVLEVAFELREYYRAPAAERRQLLAQMQRDSRIFAESLSYSVKSMQDINELVHIQTLVEKMATESEIISMIMIVDEHSRTIACNEGDRVGMIADDKGVRHIINGAEIYTRLFPRQKIYLVDMPLRIKDEFKGVVSIGYDATNYYAHLSQIRHFGLLISGVGIVLGLLLSFQVADPIVKPLQKLTEVTKKLAAGDLSQRARVKSKDEVGALAGAFNQMARDLAHSKEELDQYSKTLEEKVLQRTKELEHSNQELRMIQNELMETNMAKSEFLSIASHELRTPLTTLLGYSELLLTRSLAEDQQREFLGFINEESVRLSRIIDDLMDISRMEPHKNFGFLLKPMQITQILSENVLYYSRMDTDRRFVKEIQRHLPLVNADKEKIGYVIKNLLDNALKYSNNGVITCRAYLKDDMVWVTIEDKGIGISQEDLPQIFDRFYRIERQETAHIAGTGLGLSSARYIVESHHGRIEVTSRLGKGTTVGFGLPALKRIA